MIHFHKKDNLLFSLKEMNTQEHKELYNYLSDLSESELFELFKVSCDEETLKETAKYKFNEGIVCGIAVC